MIGLHTKIACIAFALGGCGSSAANEPASAPSDDAVKVTGATPGQIKLGRFISPDGRRAIVVDRTGAKAKLQVDGSSEIVELTEAERRSRGEFEGTDYVDPNGKTRLFISKFGSLAYFDKSDEYPMNYEKSAVALGTPTLFGAPKQEQAAWKAQSIELQGKSIVVKHPELTALDASNLKKVELAYAKADAGTFMKYVETNKEGWTPRLDVAPQNVNGPGFGRQQWMTDEVELARHKKLAAYGAVINGYSDVGRGNHIVAEAKDHRAPLANGTPGLIWSVDDNSVTFVSFDGGRYVIDIASDRDKGSKLVAALGPDSSWPKPVQDAFIDYTDLGRLAKVGGAPQASVDELSKIDDQWNECSQKVWKPAAAKIEIHKFRPEDAKALSVKTQAACRQYLDQFETSLVRVIDQRKVERAALFEKAKARATQLGLAK